ncbi:PadR family transcriptional regulator [Alkalihalobacillus sp. R86527]|uniref:PadR family transcriptional regulator n=1 Tax=Alkalihalobacillus sp. R86527 TaxID=3093863 RepID=UPI003670F58A
MENRLRNLKKAMKAKTFNDLTFTDKHKQEIYEKINRSLETEEDILFAIMQILMHENTGVELATKLRARSVVTFQDNEGFLYTYLHRLEVSDCLQSTWHDDGAKYYKLNSKGKRLLEKAEQKQSKRSVVLKRLLEV